MLPEPNPEDKVNTWDLDYFLDRNPHDPYPYPRANKRRGPAPSRGSSRDAFVPLTITGADAEAFLRSKGISFYGNEGFEIARPDRMEAATKWLVREVGDFLDFIYNGGK